MSKAGTITKDDAKARLLKAALTVFAQDGYHKASTRAIAREADVNIAAIQYYFGSKAELYREIFQSPFQSMLSISEPMDIPDLPLAEVMNSFFRSLVPRFSSSPEAEKISRLIAREEMDPSGILEDWKTKHFAPHYNRLARLLAQQFGMKRPDAIVHRLAFSLVGAASIFVSGRNVVMDFAPEILRNETAVDDLVAGLVILALDLISAEKARRANRRA